MDPDADTAARQRVERTQQVLERRLAGKPGILGFGIGSGRDSSGLALRVYVKDKAASRQLPKEIDGVEIVGDVVGAIKAW
jgi:hypothetical protein